MNRPQFAIKTIASQDDNYAQLSIEPLEKGFGHTVGNALRRVLLNSIKGAALSNVRITGVKHQFSTLDGMKEDIIELILNLKQVRVKYDGEKPVELHLEVTGKKQVTAADIEETSDVKVINKDLVLANLTSDKAKLKMVITVESGYGYQLAEEKDSDTIGVIPLDSSYSPILRVKYDVKQTRVGGRTDLNNLVMDIWTDGTITPLDAVKEASQVLISYFDQVLNPILPEPKEEPKEDPKELEILRLTVEELDLPTRIANALRKGGFETVKDLSKASKEDISKVKNLGGKSVDIVIEKIAEKGVSLKEA